LRTGGTGSGEPERRDSSARREYLRSRVVKDYEWGNTHTPAASGGINRRGAREKRSKGVWIVTLSLASSEHHELPERAASEVDCACDRQAVGIVRAYVHAHFPNCSVREFHSRSTVRQGDVAVAYADYHVISLSEDRPFCVVLTPEFFTQPVEGLAERLRRWHLASALVAEGTVIVGGSGLSPL
jgi:hypothetical protein